MNDKVSSTSDSLAKEGKVVKDDVQERHPNKGNAKHRKRSNKKRPLKAPIKRGRKPSVPFPTVPFQEALVLAEAIQTHTAGQKTRRLALF